MENYYNMCSFFKKEFNKTSNIFQICSLYMCKYLIINIRFIEYMQSAGETIKADLWNKLRVIFDKWAAKSGQIETSKVEAIVRQVLGESTKDEIDYVVNNMFRLDADGSGHISFTQFGNFLLKRHCGEISLQKMHMQHKISHGDERRITQAEFQTLINNAFAFLGVKVDSNLTANLFKEADKDKDGLMTYEQYFQFIRKYVCQNKNKPIPPPTPNEREWNSRLRRYIWSQLRKLYDGFVSGRIIKWNENNLRQLNIVILPGIGQRGLYYIMTNLFIWNLSSIDFVSFANVFIQAIAKFALAEYQYNNPITKRRLNCQEFVVIFKNTFKYFKVERIRVSLLLAMFGLIDKNHDGFITIQQYQDWVQRFIAVKVNKGEEFYLKDDDQANRAGNIFEYDYTYLRFRFNFSDKKFPEVVRKRVRDLLITYDKNKDGKFGQPEISKALIGLLKENQHELQYVTGNVLRYDVDHDKIVTYDELTNFCVQQHFGEMAIQRLHKKDYYSKGNERIMNQAEFGTTLNHALSFIQLQATPAQISTLFKQIDLDKQGWITYEVYFLFLIHYFGTRRTTNIIPDPVPVPNKTALERFISLLFNQLKIIFQRYDFNKNMTLQQNEIEAILKYVFNVQQNQISYALLRIFVASNRSKNSMTFDQLARILLEYYFTQYTINQWYRGPQSNYWKARKIHLEKFINEIIKACSFLPIKPTRQDLTEIFKSIDTNNNGYITIQEYINFIKKYLGKKTDQPKPLDIDEKQLQYINQMWRQLQVYFKKYDSGSKGYLNENDLKRFVIEVLHENTKAEIHYIFQNLFRVDPNEDKKVVFNEFAPFILRHAGEIALQKYHRWQKLGTKNLTKEDLGKVLSNAYQFLSSAPKTRAAAQHIYSRIGKGSDPTYQAYFEWIDLALARKHGK